MNQPLSRPIVIASGNGHKFRNGGNETCVERAYRLIVGGVDVLEALVAGIGIVELDPGETSVGYGGLPNADGNVQLDAACMHGPKRQAGGVAALEGVPTAAAVALKVLQLTDHHLIVGADAQRFARLAGFPIEADLNSENSRNLYWDWRRRIDPAHYLDPANREWAGEAARQQMLAAGLIDPEHVRGTIHCAGLGLRGDICCVTSTSGLAWKIPGRVGDSPLPGAGLWVDNEVGSAGSTGRGEANVYNLSSHFIVEEMRRGKSPRDAGLAALRRIVQNTVEKRLLNDRGLPAFNVNFYVLNSRGETAGVSLYEYEYAICDENGPQLKKTEPLFAGSP